MSEQQQCTVMADQHDYLPVGGRKVRESASVESSGGAFTVGGAAIGSWPRPADEPFGGSRHGILHTGGENRRAPAAPLDAAPRLCSGRFAVRLRMDVDAADVSSPDTRSAETVRIGEDEG
ncbi:MAG: hypothetical protein IRY90_11055 [Actinomadura rubrobrunea]|nr:hypothetical protein [Actinomadura rubrobrunea]